MSMKTFSQSEPNQIRRKIKLYIILVYILAEIIHEINAWDLNKVKNYQW